MAAIKTYIWRFEPSSAIKFMEAGKYKPCKFIEKCQMRMEKAARYRFVTMSLRQKQFLE